jgi:hypothetical protein
MYNSTDIDNILADYANCSNNLITKICSSVKKGDLKICTDNLEDYQIFKFLLYTPCEDVDKDLLVDKIQDICNNCEVSYTLPDTEGDEDVDGGIITEGGIQIISETGDNMVVE